MNIGLSLRKYGESRLGVLMRLWLANKGHFKIAPTSIRELLGEVSSRDERLKGIDFDNQLNDAKLLLKVLTLAEVKRGASKTSFFGEIYWSNYIKNCRKCAEIGYHCGYFNASWMKKCHIHNQKLTRYCPKCKNDWPAFAGLRQRKCSVCGVQTSTKVLQKRNAFDCKKFVSPTLILRRYFEKFFDDLEDDVCEYDLFWRGLRQIEVHKQQSPAYPSLIVAHEFLDSDKINTLKSYGINIFEMKIFSFGLNMRERKILDPNSMKELMVESRKEILRRTEIQLLNPKRLKHKFRSCFGHYFDIDKGCPSCATYDIIVDALNSNLVSIRDELFRYYIHGTYQHVIKEPGVISHIGRGSYTAKLPEEIMIALYEVELWTQVRVLYYKLQKVCSSHASHPDVSTLEWRNSNPRITECIESYSFPFFFARKRNKVSLYIPKAFLNKEIEIDKDFIKMYFPEERE